MKSIQLFFIAFVTSLLLACNSSKKGQSTAIATPSTNNGVPVPAQVQLDAIKLKYSDVTLETLTSGHTLYIGICTDCHGAKNITKYTEENWVKIMDRMAPKAKLSATEKDQVIKYVMSVKASQQL